MRWWDKDELGKLSCFDADGTSSSSRGRGQSDSVEALQRLDSTVTRLRYCTVDL